MFSSRSFSLLLLLALLCWSARGQGGCQPAEDLFSVIVEEGLVDTNGSTVESIFSTPRRQEGNMCTTGPTCCSSGAEQIFRQSTVGWHLGDIKAQLTNAFGSCRNHSLFEAIANYILQSKTQLLQDFLRIYGPYFEGQEQLFDQFYEYFANSILTGSSTNLPAEFQGVNFKLYLATFLSNPEAPRNLENTGELRNCFYNVFLNSMGPRIEIWLNALMRAYVPTMRYLRALKVVDRVVERILDFKMTEPCKASLMKMMYCGQCAGYDSHPCDGMCQNTLRGCLLDLKELEEPMQDLAEALVAMKDQVEHYDFYDQVTLLGSNFFSLVRDTTARFQQISQELTEECPDTRSAFFRRKRQAPDNGPRSSRFNIEKPTTVLNDSAYCLQDNLNLFEQLPEMYCSHAGATSSGSCWNGIYVGGYPKEVVPWTRSQQLNNPEFRICSRSQFEYERRLMRYMTRELNALTDRCSADDEDCLQVTPITHYYDFNAIDLSVIDVVQTTAAPDEIEISGSGEAPTSSSDGDRDICLTVVPTSSPGDIVDPDEDDDKEKGVTVGVQNTKDPYSAGRGLSPSGLAVVVLSVLALAWGSSWSS